MYVQHCRVGKYGFKKDSYIEYMQGPNTHSHFDLYAKVSEQKLKSNLCWSKLLTVEIAANN